MYLKLRISLEIPRFNNLKSHLWGKPPSRATSVAVPWIVCVCVCVSVGLNLLWFDGTAE